MCFFVFLVAFLCVVFVCFFVCFITISCFVFVILVFAVLGGFFTICTILHCMFD